MDQGVGLSEQPVEEQVSSTADETPVAELDSLGQAEDSRFGAADSVGWQSDRDT